MGDRDPRARVLASAALPTCDLGHVTSLLSSPPNTARPRPDVWEGPPVPRRHLIQVWKMPHDRPPGARTLRQVTGGPSARAQEQGDRRRE